MKRVGQLLVIVTELGGEVRSGMKRSFCVPVSALRAGLALTWMAIAPSVWGQCPSPIYCSGSNVGIGVPSPTIPLEILGSNGPVQEFLSGTTNHSLGIGNVNDSINRYWYFTLGTNTTDGYVFYNRQAGDTNGISIRSLGGNWHRVTMFHNDIFGGVQSDTGLSLQPYGGNVGIGTTNLSTYKLAVEGSIGAREVVVTNAQWADYVFRPGYRLKPLSEVRAYIQANHHLPDIPSEAEVKEKGVSVGEMQAKLLAKIEELTLHMIKAEEQNSELRSRVKQLEQKLITAKP